MLRGDIWAVILNVNDKSELYDSIDKESPG